MSENKYKVLVALVLLFFGVFIVSWLEIKAQLSQAKLSMEEVKPIELKEAKVEEEGNYELSAILSKLMSIEDINIIDIKVYDDFGEVLIGCDSSLEVIETIIGELKNTVKGSYVKELFLDKEKCEFTLFFNL